VTRRATLTGLSLVTVATLVVLLILAQAGPSLPSFVWLCTTTGEIRVEPDGERLRGFSAFCLPPDPSRLCGMVRQDPTFFDRVRGFGRTQCSPIGHALRSTGGVREVDGVTWERCEVAAEKQSLLQLWREAAATDR
jgi:hypothetical protein